jgi:hypothetical protein
MKDTGYLGQESQKKTIEQDKGQDILSLYPSFPLSFTLAFLTPSPLSTHPSIISHPIPYPSPYLSLGPVTIKKSPNLAIKCNYGFLELEYSEISLRQQKLSITVNADNVYFY